MHVAKAELLFYPSLELYLADVPIFKAKVSNVDEAMKLTAKELCVAISVKALDKGSCGLARAMGNELKEEVLVLDSFGQLLTLRKIW